MIETCNIDSGYSSTKSTKRKMNCLRTITVECISLDGFDKPILINFFFLYRGTYCTANIAARCNAKRCGSYQRGSWEGSIDCEQWRERRAVVRNHGEYIWQCTAKSCRNSIRSLRGRHVVLEPVSTGIRTITEIILLRVLLKVYEESGCTGQAHGQMQLEASARNRDLQVRRIVRIRGMCYIISYISSLSFFCSRDWGKCLCSRSTVT